ncbi:aminopeptidase N [Reinekea marinisedimentorum]|uniref:Aminopeptidase N n=1 Tax=Reinekea marinisedimentorum TaxID=230495 RepID=A0A4R3I3Q0_9GAMM|nr:aminopeptidase N [Reinekea marinisedimentorum]TCS40194.1 aminopeptidase N [Reinekea marinisedimentorum]
MKTETPVTIRLKDYKQPDYWIKNTKLVIRIFDDYTEVLSELSMVKNESVRGLPALVLDGVDQQIQSLAFDNFVITEYDYSGEQLTVQPTADEFVFKAVTHIEPEKNTSLEGLYKSGSTYCTQCEAEGFRKITFYLDRPDVMATFSTRIEADKSRFPVLLANGNPVEAGDLDSDRHFATWEDPFVKPAYLFAAVAGDLVRKDDSFTTCSGREISLRIFAEPHNAHKTDFAMDALKRSMRWDEEKYGREYDLDIFMIVASDYFNMGAMENKGLNIFNSAAVLANADTASDDRFERIEAIVAHEYFHNWSGNRVTCRDWFQLSLKEGFTVYRDGQFTSDMHDATVKRIKDVRFLKNTQFPEDNGPNAHPVQPQEYMEINNFYTVTVYEKGAEVVGMIHTLVGDEQFHKGADLYFERFDGMAVTTNDFVACMEEVSGMDLTQFKRWYTQAGTPLVKVEERYDAEQQQYSLSFSQSLKTTPGQSEKLPMVIPVKMALLNDAGDELSIDCDGNFNPETRVLTLTEAETTVTFSNLAAKPVPSLFRDFSAPVRVDFNQAEGDIFTLATKDSNTYNRFDAAQKIYLDALLGMISSGSEATPAIVEQVVEATLADESLSHAIKAALLTLPSYQMLVDNIQQNVDAELIVKARDAMRNRIAEQFSAQWQQLAEQLASAEDYQFNAQEAGRRELQGLALGYFALMTGNSTALNAAEALYRAAHNQTDRLNGLRAVVNSTNRSRANAMLNHFYDSWKDDTQMVETWFSMQSASDGVSVDSISALMQHEAFDITNPNKVRSVLGGFISNFKSFHNSAGDAYDFVAEKICELDALNPQMASRFVVSLENWKVFSEKRGALMKAALEKILNSGQRSPDVLEKVQKALA